MRVSIRTKLIIMSLLFLAVPSLIKGSIGYSSSVTSLDELGATGLKNNVRMTIEMIGTLQKQVEAGNLSLEDAQEQVKVAILGEKTQRGNAPSTSIWT